MNKSTILLAGIAALCAVPAVAETASVPVSFAGLDLTSSSGKDVLNRRIDQAIRTICGSPDARDLAALSDSRKCAIAARSETRPRVAIAIAASQPNVQIATAR